MFLDTSCLGTSARFNRPRSQPAHYFRAWRNEKVSQTSSIYSEPKRSRLLLMRLDFLLRNLVLYPSISIGSPITLLREGSEWQLLYHLTSMKSAKRTFPYISTRLLSSQDLVQEGLFSLRRGKLPVAVPVRLSELNVIWHLCPFQPIALIFRLD